MEAAVAPEQLYLISSFFFLSFANIVDSILLHNRCQESIPLAVETDEYMCNRC